MIPVIDKLKPKNNGSFPVVDAADVAVSGDTRLPAALDAKATQTDLAALAATVAGKASTTAVTEAVNNLQGQIDQIEISASAEAVVAPEVAAARVSSDGVEYDTLKERIDYDYGENRRLLNPAEADMSLTIGGLYTNGSYSTDTTRCRSASFIADNVAAKKVYFTSGTKHKFAYYATAATSSFVSMDADWSTDTVDELVFPSGAHYFLALIGYTDDRTITTSNLPETKYEVTENTAARETSAGVVYSSLKVRLDTEHDTLAANIATINSDIKELSDEVQKKTDVYINMEIGGLTQTGATMAATNRIRTKGFLPCDLALGKIHFDINTKHRFAYYEGNSASSFIAFSDWSTDTEEALTWPENKSFAAFYILVAYTDDRTITSGTMPKVWYEYYDLGGNQAASLTGYAIQANNSRVQTNANFDISTVIPVLPNTAYRAKRFRNTILYDADMQPVRTLATSDIENNTITTGATEKFIMFCWRTSEGPMFFAKASEYVEGTSIKNLIPLPLTGQKLSLLGDSISSYAGTIPAGNDVYYTGSNSGVTDPGQMWWSVLCSKTGMEPLIINGWSGSGITQLTDTAHVNKVPMSDLTRCQGLHDGDTEPDVILIAGGVNDYSYANSAQHNPGTWDGHTEPVSGNSFTETYACMIKNIQERYPEAVVVCLSTFFTMRGTDNGYTLLNGTGYTQPDYDKEIEKVARIMRCAYINMEQLGFNRFNYYPNFAQDSETIPTHPNALGQRTMGEFLADVLPQIVHSFTENAPDPEPEV